MRPILRAAFFRDGRGPELIKAHYSSTGSTLKATDYRNPHGSGLKHLLFAGPQVFMFTPEEVENHSGSSVDWSSTQGAGAVCLGRSPWLLSFSQQHLAKCEHYRIMFYDEYLDILCEGIEARDGGYVVA